MKANGAEKYTASPKHAHHRGQSSSYFEVFAFYGLSTTILLCAIPYGTVETWHESLLVLTISMLGGLRVIDNIMRGKFATAEPALLAPLVGILGLAVIQIVPWFGAARVISSDPYETKAFILIFGGLVIAAEILFHYTNSTHRLGFLVGSVLAVGVGSSAFGILRNIYFDSQSDLLAEFLRPDHGFAQFINRNHFAALTEMCLGLLLGILIKGKLSAKFRFVGWTMSSIMIYSIITANSRGGLVSLAGLSVFAVFVHIITRNDLPSKNDELTERARAFGKVKIRKALVAVGISGLLLGLIIIAIAFVGGDSVVTRFEKIGDEVETRDSTRINRRLIWTSTLDLIEDKPVFGSGFGAFGMAFPTFDTSDGKLSIKQAHNDYLEILANGGIVGFILFAVFAVLVAGRILKNLKLKDSFRRSSCFGAAIGLVGVLIHSFVDFGLHVAINAVILTVLVVIAASNHAQLTES